MNGKVLWGCVNMYVYIYVSIRIHCGTNFELKNVSTGTIRDEESLSQPAQKLRLERELLVEGLVSGPSHSFGYCSMALLESSGLSF